MTRRIRLRTTAGTVRTRVDDRPLETDDAAVDRARRQLDIGCDEFVAGRVVARD